MGIYDYFFFLFWQIIIVRENTYYKFKLVYALLITIIINLNCAK